MSYHHVKPLGAFGAPAPCPPGSTYNWVTKSCMPAQSSNVFTKRGIFGSPKSTPNRPSVSVSTTRMTATKKSTACPPGTFLGRGGCLPVQPRGSSVPPYLVSAPPPSSSGGGGGGGGGGSDSGGGGGYPDDAALDAAESDGGAGDGTDGGTEVDAAALPVKMTPAAAPSTTSGFPWKLVLGVGGAYLALRLLRR